MRDGKPELLAKYGAVNHNDKTTLPSANPKQPAGMFAGDSGLVGELIDVYLQVLDD